MAAAGGTICVKERNMAYFSFSFSLKTKNANATSAAARC